MLGGFAEAAVAPEHFTFALPEDLDAAQGAGLILNYHTALFALKLRGRLAEGETVLVHGAVGGVRTASIQVAKRARRTHYRGGLQRGEGTGSPRRRGRRGGPQRRLLGGSGVRVRSASTSQRRQMLRDAQRRLQNSRR